MLFPLMLGVAAGVVLERYYLSEKKDKSKSKDKKKTKCNATDEVNDGKWDGTIMDYINQAKQRHPAVVPRRVAAMKIMTMLEDPEKEGKITKETFERAKAIVEEYCGIRKLEYDDEAKTVCGGEINEECPENPVLNINKLGCLSKEELILIAPKLKSLFNC